MRLNLRVQRLKRNLTQQDVAAAIGISNQMMSDYELGKILPNYKNMKKLSDFYDVPIEDLFTEDRTYKIERR